MRALFQEAHRDGSVRVVVLGSALPKMFTAGLDSMFQTSHLEHHSKALVTDVGSLDNKSGLDPARQALVLREHILVGTAA